MITSNWPLNLYLVRFKLRIISRLSLKLYCFSLILWFYCSWFLQRFLIIISLIRSSSVKLSFIGLILMIISLWPLYSNLIRYIAFIIFCFPIKWLIVWSILISWFLFLMFFNFVWRVILFIRGFNQILIIMPLFILMLANLPFFRHYFISFVVMVISSLSYKFILLRRTMMFSLIKK